MRLLSEKPPRTAERQRPLNIAKKRIFDVIYSELKKYIPLHKNTCNKK
ncbi:hypothetical protein [Klebsiella africana]